MFNTPTRNHITIIFERLGFVFLTLILIGFNSISDSVTEFLNPEFWRTLTDEATDINNIAVVFGGVAFILVIAVVLVVSFIFWRKTFFYIAGNNFIYERRTLFKKTSKLPIANIATVNIQRSVFERLVGTSKVKLDLNSSHTANRTDFVFVLNTAAAEQLRDNLTLLKAQAHNTLPINGNMDMAAALPALKQEVISFSIAEVVRHKLLSLTILQSIAAIFVVFGTPYFDAGSAWSLQSALTVALFTFAGGGAVFIWGVANLAGYTVERDDKNIYINCGLVKKTGYTFAVEKINAVFVKQPVLARIFGLYSIEVAVVGLGNEKAETPKLCLLVSKSQMESVLLKCSPDFECTGVPVPSHKAALIPASLQAAVLTLLTIAVYPWLYYYTFFACLIVFIAAALGGWLSYKTKTLAFDDDVFHYSKGIFAKQKAMFKYGDIQDTRILTNFVLRRMTVGRMGLNILSGAKLKAHKTGYFKLPNFEAVSSKMVEHEDSSTGLLG